jgi:outer membrane protein assembly factor BamB
MRKKTACHLISYSLLLFVMNFCAYGKVQDDVQWTQPFRQCWNYDSNKSISHDIASDNEQIFIPYDLGILESVSTSNGDVLWKTELGGEIVSKIIADEKRIYVLNNSAETNNPKIYVLRSINTATGITNWSKSTNLDSEPNLYIFGQFLLLTTAKGHIIAVDKENGTKLWESNTNQNSTGSANFSNTIVFGTSDKKLLLISSLSGGITKEITTNSFPSNALLLNSERIFWGDKKGFLNSSDISLGKLVWRRRFGGEISSLTDTAEGILISSLDNFIYLLSKNGGKIIWKRRLAARVTEKPFIKDNILVVFAFGESTALFIELKSGKVINNLTLSDANYFVGNPVYAGELLVFPTLKGLYAFGLDCSKIKETGT